MTCTLGELGVRFGCVVQGDPDTLIEGVGTLAGAGPGQIAFLANARYRRFLAGTRAAAVILSADDADDFPGPALLSDDPYLTYARVAPLLAPAAPRPAGISPAAPAALEQPLPGQAVDAPSNLQLDQAPAAAEASRTRTSRALACIGTSW